MKRLNYYLAVIALIFGTALTSCKKEAPDPDPDPDPKTYTLTFHSNGGNEIPPITGEVGSNVSAPPAPTREGYRFTGWCATSFTLWDYDRFDFNYTYTIQEDVNINLFAQWVWDKAFKGIDGLTLENYPRVDGATSTRALSAMTACKLLGIPYVWGMMLPSEEWCAGPEDRDWLRTGTFFDGRLATSQTYGAMLNLIEGKADIILRSTTASPDEKVAAAAAGVTLIETPIALDAFIFIKNPANPVASLTIEQIRKIYTGQITDWSQVGGASAAMTVLTRPRNSGSEEALRELVMNGEETGEFPNARAVFTMSGVFSELATHEHGICYIFQNYKEVIMRMHDYEQTFAVNGIYPDATALKNRTYPLTTEVYAIIRSDLDRNSMAYKLYEWLQSEDANGVLTECGFVPLK